METSKILKSAEPKRNFSKYDPSGTDPNRYASVSNSKEADSYLHKGKKSIIPGLRVNVSKTERIIMVAAGAYLLYRALKKDHSNTKKVMEGITAGTMLFRGISGYCPAYDLMDKKGIMKGSNVAITASLNINKPVVDVYNAWRNLENLPQFMQHLHSVEELDGQTSNWKAKLPGGIGTIGWKAQIVNDKPNEVLSWQSIPGSTLQNAGRVIFNRNSDGNGTDIEISIAYHAPFGKAGAGAAKLLTPVFERMLQKDIESFKTYIEGGITKA